MRNSSGKLTSVDSRRVRITNRWDGVPKDSKLPLLINLITYLSLQKGISSAYMLTFGLALVRCAVLVHQTLGGPRYIIEYPLRK